RGRPVPGHRLSRSRPLRGTDEGDGRPRLAERGPARLGRRGGVCGHPIAARPAVAGPRRLPRGMSLSFPPCREPPHEARIRDALERCVAFVTERLPPSHLVAIVLTGSFARGEGSVLPRGEALRILGDLEFFVVLPAGDAVRAERRHFASWGRQASARL